jgi:hypothetical protein
LVPESLAAVFDGASIEKLAAIVGGLAAVAKAVQSVLEWQKRRSQEVERDKLLEKDRKLSEYLRASSIPQSEYGDPSQLTRVRQSLQNELDQVRSRLLTILNRSERPHRPVPHRSRIRRAFLLYLPTKSNAWLWQILTYLSCFTLVFALLELPAGGFEGASEAAAVIVTMTCLTLLFRESADAAEHFALCNRRHSGPRWALLLYRPRRSKGIAVHVLFWFWLSVAAATLVTAYVEDGWAGFAAMFVVGGLIALAIRVWARRYDSDPLPAEGSFLAAAAAGAGGGQTHPQSQPTRDGPGAILPVE